MPRIKYQKKGTISGIKECFYDELEQRYYQRICAGFVPPSNRQGALVVLGEEATWRPPAHVFWLADSQEQTLDKLTLRAVDFLREFRIQDLYGRTTDESVMRYLNLWNRDQRDRRMSGFYISSAPNSDGNISYHESILRDRLNPNKKTLHIGKSKRQLAALQELPASKIATASDRKYPMVAALGYAVSALSEWEYYEGPRPTQAKIDYDVLSYMND